MHAMSTTFRFAVVSGISLIADGVFDLLTRSRRLIKNQEKLMADFTALRGALEEQKTEMVAAVDRVGADVQALQERIARLELDTDDQDEVNALTAKVQESVETLRGIDPVKAVDDAEGGEGGDTPAPAPDVTPNP